MLALLVDQQARDQIAAEDEEQVDAIEAALEAGNAAMIGDDKQRCDRPHPVEGRVVS